MITRRGLIAAVLAALGATRSRAAASTSLRRVGPCTRECGHSGPCNGLPCIDVTRDLVAIGEDTVVFEGPRKQAFAAFLVGAFPHPRAPRMRTSGFPCV